MTNLKRIREEKGFSQSQLCAVSGIKIKTLQAYEINQVSINKAAAISVQKLADVLGVSVRDLLEEEN